MKVHQQMIHMARSLFRPASCVHAVRQQRSGGKAIAITAAVAVLATACVTSPTGRKQLMLVGDDQMNTMGVQSFQEMKKETPVSSDPALNSYVKCIVDPISKMAAQRDPEQLGKIQWEVAVFNDKQVNAFALPGGKIGVYTGLLPVAKTDAQLAAVLGHEVGHVIARHSAERVSDTMAAQGGLSILDAFILGKSVSPTNRNMIMGALGVGAQVGVLLPFGRTQESEADVIGLNLMAQAGFDPRQSIDLWKNMGAASEGKAPPELLSTHPSNESRISNLQAHLPEAIKEYNAARALGRTPSCKR